MCPHQVFCSFRSLPAPSFFLRVSNIQQQLAQLANESWPGMAEGTDGDRLQLIKEKEALLQEGAAAHYSAAEVSRRCGSSGRGKEAPGRRDPAC
jgi:hypothetical protein